MRSLSSNLLKRDFTHIQQDKARLIAVNERMMQRIESLDICTREVDRNGFVPGLSAQTVSGENDSSENGEEVPQSNVIKAGAEEERIREEASQEAERILEAARGEAEKIEQEARERMARERDQALEEARKQGYAEGLERARKEEERLQTQFQQKEQTLDQEYQRNIEELEPQFIEVITGIYEHIFHLELSSYRDVLTYLISSTMRKIEGKREFVVHVSREDYPYVSMQKKQIAGSAPVNSSVEVVEDMSLGRNQCLIKTEGGIFDCGVDTYLSELKQKLQLLSYEK